MLYVTKETRLVEWNFFLYEPKARNVMVRFKNNIFDALGTMRLLVGVTCCEIFSPQATPTFSLPASAANFSAVKEKSKRNVVSSKWCSRLGFC